jgi:hypothetical protein
MRFTHGSAINVQNAKFRICARADINAPASGVQVWVAEIVHPSPSQLVTGSGDASWIAPSGSGVVLSLNDSPGTSGTNANGGSNASTRHDWFFVISASPNTVGSKYFLAYGSVEYY